MSSKKQAFAIQVPDWVREIKDDEVSASVYAIVVSHTISGEPFTEDGLKKEIAYLGDLTKEQEQEVFDTIVSNKEQ